MCILSVSNLAVYNVTSFVRIYKLLFDGLALLFFKRIYLSLFILYDNYDILNEK